MFKKMFKTPTAYMLACRDLEDAKRALLQHQAHAEHAAKMVEYYDGVVRRLSAYVQEQSKEGS